MNFYVEEQINRTERTTNRLKGCDNITDENFHVYRDAFLECCIHCYHLKDVLIKTNASSAKIVEPYINNSRYLSQCANAANMYKHLKLNRPEREPELPKFAGDLVPIGKFWNPFTKK